MSTVPGSVGNRLALGAGAAVPRRALLAVALLSLALGAALYGGLAGERSSPAPAGRYRATSHLRPGATSALRSSARSRKQGLSSLPLAAQGPVSEALGADNSAYRVSGSSGSSGEFVAASPAQRLSASFGRSGVSVSSGSTHVGLSLRAVGYGASLGAVGEVAPRVKANRVSYERAGLSEWYVNGPVGLEQGFTIARAPSAHAVGALTLSMALSGNAHASLGSDGQSIILSRSGRPKLRYSGLTATDARGRALHSWLELKAGRILLRVDASGARYPLRVDPFVQQGEKLTGSGERGEEGDFAYSVALSATGEYALIGGPSDNGRVGAAWVFLRTSEKWAQQAMLTGKEEAGPGEFGSSVALSEKGEYAVIGGPNNNGGVGAAWVFLRSTTTWAQQAELTPKSGEETGNGEFGKSVALSAGGEYAVVGAPQNNKAVGAAWVFLRTTTTWAEQAELTPKSGEETGEGEFGASVAIAAKEGNYALVGAPENKEGVGAAWVFLRTTTTWAEQAELTPKSGEETGAGLFGDSVALSAGGEYALVGAPNNSTSAGAAWVFLRTTTTWAEQAELTPKSGEETGEGQFGASVAIAAKEGNYALVGAPNNNTGVGAAWVFLRTTTTWAEQAKLIPKEKEEIGAGSFGNSVALSSEGTTALVGGSGDREGVGAAWAFTRSSTTWTQQGEKLTGSGEVREGESSGKGDFGYSVALSATGEYALIGGPNNNGGVGAAWVFLRTGTTWAQQAMLTGSGETGSGEFGTSVALSEKGEYAVIGGPNNNGGVGAAWVFLRSTTTWAQQAELTPKSGEETGNGEFGKSVALSAGGEYAVVGAPENNKDVGAAWVFLRTTTTWAEQAELTPKSGEETGEGEFGYSVAIAAKEGNYALVGAPENKEGIGAAWVFLRTTTTWAEQAELTPKSGEETGNGEFGKSVALSAGGEYAVVGAPSNSTSAGAAWVFLRTTTTWAEQAKLIPKEKEETGEGQFGASVAIAAKEGNYALVGAPNNNTGVGAAWVFLRTTTTWAEQAELTGTGEYGAGSFGDSVALSSEGTTALTGGWRDSTEIGAGWAFTRSTTTWTQQGEKLTGSGETGPGEYRPGKGQFGYSVALSEKGEYALIGGPNYVNGAGESVGAAWIFARTGEKWAQQGFKLAPKEEIGAGEFGKSVALSANGTYALIGGWRDNGGVGAAWVFMRTGEKWTQQGTKLTAKSGEEVGAGEFGGSVALSATGEYALIGGFGEKGDVGAAWVFTRSGEKWTQQGEKLAAKSGEEVGAGEFGVSVALSSEGTTALIGGNGDNTNLGAAWVFTRTGEKWTQQGAKLTGKEEVGTGQFGGSVALSSEGTTALIGGPGDNSNVGAAWLFTRTGSNWSQQGEKLTGKEEVGPGEFGVSVALSANATTALIGGPRDNSSVGAAWVFTHSGATWSQLGSKLTGKEEVGAGEFGSSVAVSSEGTTALIGGSGDKAEVGAAWVFVNTSPTVVTKAASSPAQTSATLNATVNPDGAEVTKCEFEWGKTTAYEEKAVPCASLPTGSGTSPVAVSASLTGLTANTTYHFRIAGTNANGTSKGADETFKTFGAPTTVTEKASSITQTTATLNATVNPDGENVTECKFEYATATYYEAHAKTYETSATCPLPGSGTSAVPVSASITGLTANTTYHFRIVATNAGGKGEGADETLKTLPNPPTVVTEKASSIAQTTATLNGTVNPNNGEVSECKFEYATSAYYEAHGKAYEASASCTPAKPGGSGSTAAAASASITGLTGNTTYHFRIVASNAGGKGEGADQTLKTVGPPVVVTENASSIMQTTATLNGTVNPNGGEVTQCTVEYISSYYYEFYEFEENEYSPKVSVPCSSLPGSGTSAVAVHAAVTGLSPNSAYIFRISATNAAGTITGSNGTFTTLPNPPTVVTEKASSITQTTATLNAAVNPNEAEVSECKFEYATAEYYEAHAKSYGSSASCTPAKPGGSGSTAAAATAALSGLTANTTYHFRIVATNAGGPSKGADETLKTLPNPPTVVTEKASSIAQTTATLNGTVNPNGGEVSECKFEYATATYYEAHGKAYETSASCTPAKPGGSGSTAAAATAALSGLTANTTYHFRIVATNAGGPGKGADETLKTLPNRPTLVTEKASSITQTTATLNGTVNPNSGEVSECKFEYATNAYYEAHGKTYETNASCTPAKPGGAGSTAAAATAALTGLTANTTYHFRIVATNAGGKSEGADETLKTLPNPPTVVTGTASPVAQTTATLNAMVNPNGGEVKECKFEYGLTILYEKSVSCASLPGSGTSAVAVSASVTGLVPNTSYHFRIVATNAGGKGEGADETLTTLPNPPTVVTEKATAITQTTATLNASVNPNAGEVKECKFEYGTSISYGKSASCASLPGSGILPVPVSAGLTGLTSNTTYHFRIVASNSGGKGEGADETFKTQPSLTVTTSSLPAAELGTPYSQTLAASGGTTPYSWSLASGSLPAGLSLSEGGQITGTPTAAGTSSFTVKVTDSSTPTKLTATANLAIAVTEPTYSTAFSSYEAEGKEAKFQAPNALAVDPSGNLWVADSAKDRIVEFSSAGKDLREFGSEGSGEGQFNGISGIAANASGDIYVSDPGNHRIQEFGPAGEHLRSFGSLGLGEGQFETPGAIAIDSSGDVWVLNSMGIRVEEFSSAGAYISGFGSSTSPFLSPTGLAFSGGNLYVTEASFGRVVELSTAGAILKEFGSLDKPSGIATDPSTGNLYVSELGSNSLHYSEASKEFVYEHSNNRVQEWSPQGTLITAFGSYGSGAGQFSSPRGVAVSSAGTVYVADTGNARVSEWAQAP